MGTQTTDSLAKGLHALTAMERHAAHLSEVAARLLTEHAGGLPELLAVRAEATDARALLALQPRTVEDARLWAAALGVAVTVSVEDGGEDRVGERAAVEFVFDGVLVRLASYQSYTADEWADRIAEAVAV